MIKVQITKVFHKTSKTGILQEGDVFQEPMTFVNFDDAIDWGLGINRRSKKLDYHITKIVHGKDFVYYDRSMV